MSASPIPAPVTGAADGWTNFVPNTLSSLVAGAIVALAIGVLLWRIQRTAQGRLEIAINTTAWTLNRTFIANALRPLTQTHLQGIGSIAERYGPFLNELRNLHIAGWTIKPPYERELKTVQEIALDIARLQKEVVELQKEVRRQISEETPEREQLTDIVADRAVLREKISPQPRWPKSAFEWHWPQMDPERKKLAHKIVKNDEVELHMIWVSTYYQSMETRIAELVQMMDKQDQKYKK
jgi:hypothetical protein